MSPRVTRLEDLPPEMQRQARAQLGVSRGAHGRSKYGNKVIEFEGHMFGSKWELERWGELREQLAVRLIADLRHHVSFPLHVVSPIGDRVRVAAYEADFVYRRGEQLVIEDTKSEPTRRKEAYRLKAKHFEAEYGLRIIEVLRARRRKRNQGSPT